MEEGWWMLLEPGCRPIAVAHAWEVALEYVQARANARRQPLRINLVKFHDGSRVKRVYGNVYVAFNSLDHQDHIEICETLQNIIDMGGFISFPPDSEDAYLMDRIEFDNGTFLFYKEVQNEARN